MKFRTLFLIVLLYTSLCSGIAQPPHVFDAGKLQLALKRLSVLGSVLYIGAHPDDENTAMLAYCVNEKLFRTAYLSLTRGDGGQNLIGSEQGELLGVIRTQELLAARRFDGAEQYFTRALDFGYSKSPEETFKFWNKEKILSDVVWVIRNFQPDVIITRFPTTGEGGHGHHTASAILAEEAFYAAADSSRFREQLKYVKPWKAKRLVWNVFQSLVEQQKTKGANLLQIDVGKFNPLIGKSYTEISSESRSMHKSQGFGSSPQRSESINYFAVVAGENADNDIFEGIHTDWSRVQDGEVVGKILDDAYKNFNPESPEKTLPLLLKAYQEINNHFRDNNLTEAKQKDLLDVIRSCAGLWMEAIANDYSYSQGDSIKVAFSIINRGNASIRIKSLGQTTIPQDNIGIQKNYFYFDSLLYQRKPFIFDYQIPVGRATRPSHPYWIKTLTTKVRFQSYNQQPQLWGMPESPYLFNAYTVIDFRGTDIPFKIPVLFRWNDPVDGERYRPIEIAPPVMVNLDEKVYVFPNNQSKPIRCTLKSGKDNSSGTLKLKLPEGWSAKPDEISFSLQKKRDEQTVSFTITPPAKPSEGMLTAEVKTGEGTFSYSIITIEHSHIPKQTLFPPAQAKLVRLNIATRAKNIGYIMGAGDEIPTYLRQLGYNVTLLSDNDLNEGKFSAYDAIITGVRAYNTRQQLKQVQPRLLEYVKGGGTLVVQYCTNRDLVTENIGPSPFKISNERVTDETAAMAFLEPSHPLLNAPNKISQSDFDGWMQERGIYFASEWDSSYQTVLACSDTGERPKKGGLLYTRYGKGVFIYTGYVFFREIPAGVAGAYKLFVNMIEANAKGKNVTK
jgi:LmbE family N-acetylglucosaminyl deacetylase